jgi:hypothetical protein
MFSHITVGQNTEKKSTSIGLNSVFIDNEFHQLLEVRLRTGIPVLNLDQIDFFEDASLPFGVDTSDLGAGWSHIFRGSR